MITMFAISFLGPMFVPGATAPDENPLKSFVDQSVSTALIKYFEDKGDPGIQVNNSPKSVSTLRTNCAIPKVKNLRGNGIQEIDDRFATLLLYFLFSFLFFLNFPSACTVEE